MTEYKETTNRSVYNKLHKEQHASCSFCTWHSRWFNRYNENDAWDSYWIDADRLSKKSKNIPSWKLCSKNKKQWMKKPLRYKKIHSYYFGDHYFEIHW